MTSDQQLLDLYAHAGSQEAFAELVRRHVGLVYGSALRQLCGNASLAEEAAQSVFIALAAQAQSRTKVAHLAAWLHATTRFTVSHVVRAERRRQDRERKAQALAAVEEEPGREEMAALPPEMLEPVLEALPEGDREVLLQRFIEGRPYAALAGGLGVSEDAARMRVARALERAREVFARRGITSTAAAIGAALAGQAVAAPAGLAAQVAAVAAVHGTAIAGATGAGAGLLSLMTTAKTAAWIAGALAVLALGLATYEGQLNAGLRRENARLLAAQGRLQGALGQSRGQLGDATLRAARAERQRADLQHRLAAALPPRAAPPAAVPAETVAARLARMKPALAAGQPIRGALIVLVNGEPRTQEVAFVMGKETRWAVDDRQVYSVRPTLEDDGTVKYAIEVLKRDPAGGPDQVLSLPFVVQTPWEGYSLDDGQHTVAFDPDPPGP